MVLKWVPTRGLMQPVSRQSFLVLQTKNAAVKPVPRGERRAYIRKKWHGQV
jgi:hypothetical protein